MRIILCHNNYSISGGAEVFYHELGRVLVAHGHTVAYFSAYEKDNNSTWNEYFPVVAQYQSGNILSRTLSIVDMVYNRQAKKAMVRLIRDFKPDIIHAFAIYVKLTPSILDAAHEAGVPVVMSCNDYKHICPNYKLYHHGHICEDCKGGLFYNAIKNRCCHDSLVFSTANSIEAYINGWRDAYRKNVNTFLFASEFMAHKTEEYWGSSTFRWRMLKNPYNAKKYNLPNKTGDYALYFGRLINEKGVKVLLDAAVQTPEIPLVVVGDGPDRHILETQAAKRGAHHVQFEGPKWKEEMDRILRGSRFVIIPSLWHENFPYVILQSFAFGKPVIGSNRGGIPELIGSDKCRGLIYDANDAAALAASMRSLMVDDKEVKRMGGEAKKYVDDEFNDDRFYERLMEIYKEVLK